MLIHTKCYKKLQWVFRNPSFFQPVKKRSFQICSVSGMTKSQARQKADLMLMIKTPLSLQSHLENPEAEGQFEGEIEEWIEASDKDFEEDDKQ